MSYLSLHIISLNRLGEKWNVDQRYGGLASGMSGTWYDIVRDHKYKKKNISYIRDMNCNVWYILRIGNEQNVMAESGNIHIGNGPPPLPPPLSPQAPWQNHHPVRVPWGRPPPIPRDGELPPCPGLPPINMPPPQIRPRGRYFIRCVNNHL